VLTPARRQSVAGAARQRDAARRSRDDRRALLRRADARAAEDDLREPRHALLDQEGKQEVTSAFAGGALALLLAAGARAAAEGRLP
jgi:hypothetical protein